MCRLLPLYIAVSVLTGCSSNQLQMGTDAPAWIEPVQPKVYESQNAIARPLFETYEPGEVQVFPHSRLGQGEVQRASPSENQRPGNASAEVASEPPSVPEPARSEIDALNNRIAELEAQLSAMTTTLAQLEESNSALEANQSVSGTPEHQKAMNVTSRHVTLKATEPALPQPVPVVATTSDIVVFFKDRQAASTAINDLSRAGHTDSFLSYSDTRQTYVVYLGRYADIHDTLSLIGTLKQLLPLEYQILAEDRVLTPSAFSA